MALQTCCRLHSLHTSRLLSLLDHTSLATFYLSASSIQGLTQEKLDGGGLQLYYSFTPSPGTLIQKRADPVVKRIT
ncbi:MAG: hypothetical protein ABIU05_04525 [Nitrospirales bacterium]